MKKNKMAKKVAAIFKLMVGATILSSCGNSNGIANEIVDESNENAFEINDSGIYIVDLPYQIDVCDSERKTEMTEELYEEIKTRVENCEYNSLVFHLNTTPIDFTDINIDGFSDLSIDCPDIDFNYAPFYNRYYESLSITISKDTNKEAIQKLLETATFNDSYLGLEFTENISSEEINAYLDEVSKLKNLDWVQIETSANLNDLTFAKIACNNLSISHYTDEDMDYTIELNDYVKKLDVTSSYPTDFKNTTLLENLKVISNSEELEINQQVSRYANAEDFSVDVTNETTIDLPDKSQYSISNANVNDIGDAWFKQFSNVNRVKIGEFYYNCHEGTLNEAIKELHFEELEDKMVAYLEENGIIVSVNEDLQMLKFRKRRESSAITDSKVYDFLNETIKHYDINRIKVTGLEREIDFGKLDLSNITFTDLADVGYNFDYQPFIENNAKKPPVNALDILINPENNHENKINYIKSFPLIENAYISIHISEDVDVETASSYLNALDYTKISQLNISYEKISELDLSNIKVSELTLVNDFHGGLINYDVEVNEEVQYLVLGAFIDSENEKTSVIDKIKVQSKNQNLDTIVIAKGEDLLDMSINTTIDGDTIISVPKNSGLSLSCIDESSVSEEILEQFRDCYNYK